MGSSRRDAAAAAAAAAARYHCLYELLFDGER